MFVEYITRTPITQPSSGALMKWRKTAPFSLRSTCLQQALAVRIRRSRGLHRSLEFLDPWLTAEDVVTVNPLLPTNGTLVEKISGAGFWRPLRTKKCKL